jgi:uncharacterized protein YggE
MTRFLNPLAVLFVAAAALHAEAQPPRPAVPPTVVASGKAVVKRAPDRAFVSFATETRAPRPEQAQKDNAAVMAQVRKKLASEQIPDEAIQTTSFNLHEDVDWVNGKRVPRGYVVTNVIEVRVDALDQVGRLLDGVVAAGATSVGGVRFDLKDRSGLEREALRLAVVDARARADAVAAGAGTRIVRIQTIEEQGAVDVPRPMMRMEMAAMADAAPQTPVAPGEIEIVATVRLTAVIDAQ